MKNEDIDNNYLRAHLQEEKWNREDIEIKCRSE